MHKTKTGYKLEGENQDFHGADISKPDGSLEECFHLCDITPGCIAFIHGRDITWRPSSYCVLKSQLASLYPLNGADVYVKEESMHSTLPLNLMPLQHFLLHCLLFALIINLIGVFFI